MKLTKTLGIAVVMTTAATALISAGIAQAAPDEVVFCKVHKELCPAGEFYPEGTVILAELPENETTQFLGRLNEECKHSHLAYLIDGPNNEEGMGDPLELDLDTFTFSECGDCKETVAKLSGATLKEVVGTPDYRLTTSGTVKMSGCPLGITCEFGFGEINFRVSHSVTSTSMESLSDLFLIGGNSELYCGPEVDWVGIYTVMSPKLVLPALYEDLRP